MASAKSFETHHNRLLEMFRSRILDGTWAPGIQLDKETDLANEHGVSRMTMNKVLTQLAQEGYLVRRKRRGTIVAKARTQAAVMAINNIADDVAALGRSYRWQLITQSRRAFDARDRRLFGVAQEQLSEQTLFLTGVHFADEEPFCLEARAINLEAVSCAEKADFHVEVPGSWLIQTMPWSTARHSIRAINVQGADAKHLEVAVGAACLEILRKTDFEDAWVTYARFLYPGEAFQLTAEFET